MIVHPSAPDPQQVVTPEQAAADELAGRICHAAATAARADCHLLELIGDFDATGAVRWWSDMKSLAHWLMWACAMSPGTAREHVRVARALRQMPTVLIAFRDGRLSYSKVRELTRVVDVIDEAKLCALALEATASQLATMIRGFRTADGHRLPQEHKRAASWHRRGDGLVDFRICLPADEAATLIAAVTAAKDHNQPVNQPEEQPGAAESGRYTNADAVLDLARQFLAASPEDRSGEDRTTVVVHVSVDLLAEEPAAEGVPAGTPEPAATLDHDVCYLQGIAPIEPETARRLACDADLIGAVVDAHGDVLALGRTRRLVSRAQRRALMVRDRMCQFPGCHQHRHLKAHHILSWACGGPTDLGNLILLCQWHHTAVHEGGISIRRLVSRDGLPDSWRFVMPDGKPYRHWYTAERLPHQLLDQQPPSVPTGSGFDHPDNNRLRGRTGERADLHACIQALFSMKLPDPDVTLAA